jgi:hypothetical protein
LRALIFIASKPAIEAMKAAGYVGDHNEVRKIQLSRRLLD